MYFQAEAELCFSKNSDCYLYFGKSLLKVYYPRSIPSRGLMGFLIHGNFLRSCAIHFGELYMFSVSPQFHSPLTHELMDFPTSSKSLSSCVNTPFSIL